MRKLVLMVLVAFSYPSFSQEDIPTNVPTLSPLGTLDRAARAKKTISATTPDNEIIYKSLDQIEKDIKKGTKLYKKEKYEKAYKVLSELAQWGIKNPQAIVGMMYIKGQHVDQSIEKGLAWLGVANEIDLKDSKETYDYIYNQLNDTQKAFIDQKVAKYVEMYGMETQNLVCEKRTKIGSNIPKLTCAKKLDSNSPLYPIE